jgi:hypothetical protein
MVLPAETTISVSEFLKCLSKKFYEDYRNSNNGGFFANEGVNLLKFLFNGCCDHLKNYMLENNLMYLIRGKFNVDYFLNEFYNCFKESIRSTKRSIGVILISSKNVNITLKVLIDFFDVYLLELQEKALNDLCESKLFFSHLLKYVEKNIKTFEDYINIENRICDYHNTLVYIVNSDSTFKNRFENFYFSKPIFIDENNYKIIDGIEIYFEHKPNFKCVKGHYSEEDFVILEKDVYYFISDFDNLYCPSDILRKLNWFFLMRKSW